MDVALMWPSESKLSDSPGSRTEPKPVMCKRLTGDNETARGSTKGGFAVPTGLVQQTVALRLARSRPGRVPHPQRARSKLPLRLAAFLQRQQSSAFGLVSVKGSLLCTFFKLDCQSPNLVVRILLGATKDFKYLRVFEQFGFDLPVHVIIISGRRMQTHIFDEVPAVLLQQITNNEPAGAGQGQDMIARFGSDQHRADEPKVRGQRRLRCQLGRTFLAKFEATDAEQYSKEPNGVRHPARGIGAMHRVRTVGPTHQSQKMSGLMEQKKIPGH